jgi:hypothetical protein
MSTIVETLNIGFVIPLIEMECELTLTLSQKGILNGAAFIGNFNTSFNLCKIFEISYFILF